MSFNPDFNAIGEAFVSHFYSAFDVNDPNQRAQALSGLYDPENSYMTFEGVQVKGRDAILQKFSGLTFREIRRAVTKTDCQPLPDGSILVSVLGQLKTDEDPVNSYNQVFILKPSAGSFYISNEIFRLMSTTTKGKQATRGQKQIFEENRQTLQYYFAAAAIASTLGGGLYTMYFYNSVGPYFWTAWAFAVIAGFGGVLMMKSMIKEVRNEKNQLVDAGYDLNDPTAIGEYCKDAVILSVISQVLSLLWSKFIFLIALLPLFAAYKVWVNWLGPWFFAPAPEEEPIDEKKLRKQQRVKYVRR
ncbi:hypothetical protein FO519_005897 [Halicephalobus sp. NKZ332]|nr:hypothetical protein FO519_005897 [Halicephalobus sp. NKZ332]